MKVLDLERHLAKHGCEKKREGGAHTIWQNSKGKISTVPRHKEIKTNTAKAICKQLEIPPPLI